ncbi:dihydropteridine reductase [Achromatium sp. WMS3]|nr:dihydropteridine reductase [Achromatium sp. WMS3]
MNIAEIAARRYSAKVFDPQKPLDSALLEQLQSLLHLAPSSTNSQPWHFVVASSYDAKETISKATVGPYAANASKVLTASHVIVLCARTELEEPYLLQVLEQEEQDGRFKTSSLTKEAMHRGRSYYVNMHSQKLKDTQQWMEKQVYLALGALLFSASALGIDSCPIEGFDRSILNTELELTKRNLTSVVIVALGYHSDKDFNATLPKSRLPIEELFTYI